MQTQSFIALRKIALSVFLLLISISLFAQALTSSITDSDIGGTVNILNPAKTADGAASAWKIYNMSGIYGNSLQFWAYDNLSCGNGLCSNRFTLMDNGNVGIGVLRPNEKLAVNGTIRAKEIKVETTNWPDYVFDQDYEILGLQELDAYIKSNKHLPEMPSAKEVQASGIALGEMVKLQQKKIEELTLHLIAKDKDFKKLEQQQCELVKKVEWLMKN